MVTPNENANKILALLEGLTYGEADEALHVASDYLVKSAQEMVAKTPIKKAPASGWTPPSASKYYR